MIESSISFFFSIFHFKVSVVQLMDRHVYILAWYDSSMALHQWYIRVILQKTLMGLNQGFSIRPPRPPAFRPLLQSPTLFSHLLKIRKCSITFNKHYMFKNRAIKIPSQAFSFRTAGRIFPKWCNFHWAFFKLETTKKFLPARCTLLFW